MPNRDGRSPVCRRVYHQGITERKAELQLNDKGRLLGLLGLARRGGNLTLGTVATRQAIRSRKVCLVLMAQDLSESSAAKAAQIARAVKIPIIRSCTKAELSGALGRENLGVVGVTDPNLAGSIVEIVSPAPAPTNRKETDQES